MKRFLIITLAIIAIFLALPLAVNFQTNASFESKTLTYDIDENGTTRITYSIHLANDNLKTYIAKYTLSTGLEDITSVTARKDNGTSLTTKIITQQDTKLVEVRFPQPRGVQKELNWNLSFSSDIPVSQIGKVFEVVVPGFMDEGNITIIVKYPKTHGKANYLSSEPSEVKDDGAKWQYIFSDPSVKDSGVFLSYGDEQVFDFNYQYQLKNEEENTNLRASITLPPDYKNQRIFFDKITPLPQSSMRDTDGNTIIEYLIKPGDDFQVKITGKAVLTNGRENHFDAPDYNLEKYLKPDSFWEVEDTEIVELAMSLIEGKETNDEKAKAIYDFVVTKLTYSEAALEDSERTRLGALEALHNKDNVICQEYTDLFVTLSRAAGVPTRMLAGHTTAGAGYDLPENTLHAWAEYYSEENGWIFVDPTWASTSNGFNFFDNIGLNHFVLAIRGESSERPPLVLSFSTSDDSSDNLVITPSTTEIASSGEVEITFSIPEEIKTLVNNKGTITVTNNTNQVLSEIDFTSAIPDMNINFDGEKAFLAVFPGETKVFTINLRPKNIFASKILTLNIEFEALLGQDADIIKSETVYPELKTHEYLIYGLVAIAIVLTIAIVASIFFVVKKVRGRRI